MNRFGLPIGGSLILVILVLLLAGWGFQGAAIPPLGQLPGKSPELIESEPQSIEEFALTLRDHEGRLYTDLYEFKKIDWVREDQAIARFNSSPPGCSVSVPIVVNHVGKERVFIATGDAIMRKPRNGTCERDI